MTLTDCSRCRYLDRKPNHSGDVICAVAPHYASMWSKLNSLDEHTLGAIPVDPCREFELNPSLTEKEINFSLSFQQWQQLARNSSCSKLIFDFLKDQLIDHPVTLSVEEWQVIADNSQNPQILEALKKQGIEPEEIQESWIEVDSSCIDAIAFNQLSSKLSIRFNSREVYEYSNVCSDIFQDFLDADSKGHFFNFYIKDEYPYSHIGFDHS